MKIKINNKETILPDGATLADALKASGAATSGIATAVNGEVVPADERAARVLNENDMVIVVTAFYGG